MRLARNTLPQLIIVQQTSKLDTNIPTLPILFCPEVMESVKARIN